MAFFMNRNEAADFLGISRTYFSILVNDPDTKIPYITLRPDGNGRKYYRQEELEQWAVSQTKLLKQNQKTQKTQA